MMGGWVCQLRDWGVQSLYKVSQFTWEARALGVFLAKEALGTVILWQSILFAVLFSWRCHFQLNNKPLITYLGRFNIV